MDHNNALRSSQRSIEKTLNKKVSSLLEQTANTASADARGRMRTRMTAILIVLTFLLIVAVVTAIAQIDINARVRSRALHEGCVEVNHRSAALREWVQTREAIEESNSTAPRPVRAARIEADQTFLDAYASRPRDCDLLYP